MNNPEPLSTLERVAIVALHLLYLFCLVGLVLNNSPLSISDLESYLFRNVMAALHILWGLISLVTVVSFVGGFVVVGVVSAGGGYPDCFSKYILLLPIGAVLIFWGIPNDWYLLKAGVVAVYVLALMRYYFVVQVESKAFHQDLKDRGLV